MNESEINKLINSMTKKFENGGFIDCLRNGGSVEKCKCGCDKIAKAEGGKKVRRTDMPGYAYTLSDGTDVLTQDAVGIQPLPGSNYSIAGSSPEYETQRTTLTDKSGNVAGYNYNVYVNDGDHFGPINKYTTKECGIDQVLGLEHYLLLKLLQKNKLHMMQISLNVVVHFKEEKELS